MAETTQTFAQTSPTNPAAKVAYKVLDEKGLDITSTISDVEVQATGLVATNGTVITTTEGSAFAYVVVTKEDGTELKSDRITVKVEAAKVAEITDFTVDSNSTQGAFDFEDTDYKQNTKVPVKGSTVYLHVETKNQFGETDASSTAKFESLDLDVAVVDAASGLITPIKEGKFAVKITDGTVSKTVELEVVAEAKATTIELDKTEVSVSNKANSSVKVKATVKNQFDTEMLGQTITAAATTNAGKDLVDVTVVGNEISVAPKAGVKSGTATIEVKVSNEVKTTFTVTVTEAGTVDSYKLVGFESKLDKNADNTTETPVDATLSVVPVDENGAEAGTPVDNATYIVTDKDNKVVEGVTADSKIEASELAVGTYTLTVKVGTVTVATETFEVVNTTPQPELEFTATTVTDADYSGDAFDEVAAKLKATLAGSTVASDDLTVDKIVYTTTNSDVVKSAATNTIAFEKDGSVDLLIGKVTVTIDNAEYTIDMNNFKLTVVSDAEKVAAEAALTSFLETAKGYTWNEVDDSPAIGNYAALAGLTFEGTTVTADLSEDTTIVQSIMEKPSIETAIGKEATFENVSNYYVMNTVSRYLAALHRTADTPVDTIVYDGVTYSWNSESDNGKGSKWVTANGPSLVAAIVADNAEGISSVEFTLVDENENSIDVTLEVTAPLAPVEEL